MSDQPKFGEWQPIETAPTCSEHLIVLGGIVRTGWLDPDGITWKERMNGLEFWGKPDCWMPLPQPPY